MIHLNNRKEEKSDPYEKCIYISDLEYMKTKYNVAKVVNSLVYRRKHCKTTKRKLQWGGPEHEV